MKIEQRTVYISEDGKEFDNEGDCLEHEKSKNFESIVYRYIDKFSEDLLDSDVKSDVAQAVTKAFKDLMWEYNAL